MRAKWTIQYLTRDKCAGQHFTLYILNIVKHSMYEVLTINGKKLFTA